MTKEIFFLNLGENNLLNIYAATYHFNKNKLINVKLNLLLTKKV